MGKKLTFTVFQKKSLTTFRSALGKIMPCLSFYFIYFFITLLQKKQQHFVFFVYTRAGMLLLQQKLKP